MKHRITTGAYALPLALVAALFFMWGFARNIIDVLNRQLQLTEGAAITEASGLQVVTYLGYFLMAVPAGLLINRCGYRRGVVCGLSLFALGAFLFVPAEGLVGYLVALFVVACGLAVLEVSANPYATELGPRETATSRLNLAQSFNGMGQALAPVVMGWLLFARSGSIRTPYVVMGALVVCVALVFARVRLPEPVVEEEETEAKGGLGNLALLMRNRMFVFGLGALLAYEIGEISINSYFVTFASGMGWLADDVAAYLLSLSLFIFMGGRFVGSWIMTRLSAERFLLWCACGSVLCLGLMLLGALSGAVPPAVCLALLMLNYLCEAIMFPTIFSLCLRPLGALRKSAASVLMMTPVGGCAYMLMALIAAGSGSLVLPFCVPLAGFVVVMLYARRLMRSAT